MASKASFNANEWELIKDAPEWVFAALSAAEGNVALTVKAKESKGFKKAVEGFEGRNQLIRDVVADKTKPAKALKRATLSDAEEALEQIGDILDERVGRQEADDFRDFLLAVGDAVAEAAGEGALGAGKKVSKKEFRALGKIEAALKATEADKKARRQAEAAQAKREEADARAKREAAAKTKREATAKREVEKARKERETAAKAKREAAKAKREAEKARQEREAAAKAKRETAKAKREAEADARRKAEAKREAEEARQEREALAQAKREAAAKAQREAQEAATSLAAAAATTYIAEHTVVPGDSLSAIAKKYYGSTARDKWMAIYEENKAIIGDNPNLIHPGQVFKIPKLG
jgi:LysM repeat protein